MVRILANGEIVADDDPRLSNQATSPNTRNNSNAGSASTSAPPAPQRQGGFDLNAEPFRTIPDPDSPISLPILVIFGVQIPAVQAAGAVALLMFFGVKGLLFASLIWYLIRNNIIGGGTNNSRAAARRVRVNGAPGATSFVQNFMQQSSARGPSRQPHSSSQPTATSNAPPDPWSSKGKGHKLGD